MESKARYRHEDISAVPRGWKVRTVTHQGSGHRIRVAFPPGRKQKGSGEVVSILHPLHGHNPCGGTCTLKSTNPAELMVMGANPPRRRSFGDYALEKWGSKWVVSKAGSVITQPMTRKQAKEAINWYSRSSSNPSAEYVEKELRQAEEKLREARKAYADARTRAVKRRADADIQFWGNKAAYLSHARTNPSPELVVMSANPTVAANPGAAELYEQFQGRAPKWETIDVEPHMPKGDYAKLGQLVAISVKPLGGGQVQVIQWYTGTYDVEGDHLRPLIDPPMLVSDESGRQIYFFKGNQDISDAPHPWLSFGGPDPGDGVYELGEARVIRYRTRKAHDNEELLDYVHRFGEESGVRPKVLYDSRNKRLLLEGGNYRVEAPGIID